MADPVDRIEFHFDPMCPWAYQGSLWIREVRARTGLEIDWRFFSLEEVNLLPGKKHPWEREWSFGWSQMRVGALLRRRSSDAVDRWYQAVGAAFFERGERTHDPDVHRRILDEIGFGAETLDAALADPTTHDEVRADHERAVGTHAAWGVPLLVFPNGHAVFGPVVLPAPTGDDAVRLWELTTGWAELPNLYEIQHPKRADDLRLIAERFAPYLAAREWRTVQNPTP